MVKISKKIILTVFIVTMLTVCLFAFNASAANEGPYVYEIKSGEVTITHCDPTNIEKDVVIPEKLGGITVTAIGDKAFYFCSSVETVTMSNNIKSIGARAFAYCGALSEVVISENVEVIKDEAFDMCFNLSRINLSKTKIKSIGARAFENCEFLESITLPDTLETVGEGAFNGCYGLNSVIIGKKTASIGKNAFSSCQNLHDVYYMGTKDQFAKISIAEGNNRIKDATQYFEHIHIYDKKEKISAGDCVIKGQTRCTCRCGDYYYEYAYGSHSYKDVITKATFKANGKIQNKCKLCGNVKKTTTIPKVTATLAKTKYAYTGKAITPEVTVKNSSGTKLTKDKDYTLKYSSGRTKMGKYSVTVKLSGSKHSGSTTLNFNIVPGTPKVTAKQNTTSITLTWKKITGATGYKVYSYDTKTEKYTAIKSLTGTSYTISKLSSGKDYVYTVRAYAKVGDETIWGSHGFIYTATVPATVKELTVKQNGAGKATLSWKKTSSNGYEVYMATGKDGKYNLVKTITSGSTITYTKSSLKAGKTYYFSVRAFKTVGDTKIYGEYSSVKTVSIK